MSMKLLSKSEVAKAQADAKKREIDEGLKLARKVDNLREIKSQEEASLEKFRKERVAAINLELSELETKKETLIGENRQLERERKELLKPLDVEWENIHKGNAALAKREDAVSSREALVSEKEVKVQEKTQKTSKLLSDAILKDERTAELLKDADKASKEAHTTLKNAREIEAKALSLKKEVENELAERDRAMAVRERDFGFRNSSLEKRESDLEKEWKLLEDRKAMHERHIKRNS